MCRFFNDLCLMPTVSRPSNLVPTACAVIALAALSAIAHGQAPTPPTDPSATPPSAAAAQAPTGQAQPAEPQANAPVPESAATQAAPATTKAKEEKDPTLSQGAFSIRTVGGEIKEDQLKQLLVGKTLYLRGRYQDNNLEFDELGRLTGHSTQGSYTLSQIQINKVKLSKKKLELTGDRYALHFLGAAAYDDPTSATDRVKINPKKKAVRISFDREEVEKATKKEKDAKNKDKHDAKTGNTEIAAAPPADAAPALSDTAATQPNLSGNPASNDHRSDKGKLTTKSAAQASQVLLSALDKVFSVGVDERMIAAMPDFWKLYYQAAQAKTDYKPSDPDVLGQGAVDQKAKLISAIDPPSNEFAQANGVAGIALYHAVIGSNGKVEEVVAGRPIGFGLDESAEQTIRKATFQPALKDGKPVPVALDLVVSFRIYSKRTSQPAGEEASEKPKESTALPGPYTLQAQTQAQVAQRSNPAQ
jgi:hypothetical protein